LTMVNNQIFKIIKILKCFILHQTSLSINLFPMECKMKLKFNNNKIFCFHNLAYFSNAIILIKTYVRIVLSASKIENNIVHL